jgi:hypothetical protein
LFKNIDADEIFISPPSDTQLIALDELSLIMFEAIWELTSVSCPALFSITAFATLFSRKIQVSIIARALKEKKDWLAKF